jgi:hypothetical protein
LARSNFCQQHDGGYNEQRDFTDAILRFDDPGRPGPPVDPLILIGDCSGKQVGDKNKQSADAEAKKAVKASGLQT